MKKVFAVLALAGVMVSCNNKKKDEPDGILFKICVVTKGYKFVPGFIMMNPLHPWHKTAQRVCVL